MKEHVGHRIYDNLLVKLLHRIASYQLREELLEYFCNELFDLSSCEMILVLESSNVNISNEDEVDVFKLLDRNKNRDLLQEINSKRLKKKSESSFSVESLNFKLLLEVVNLKNSIENKTSYHTSTSEMNFFLYYIPFSSFKKGGWVSIIYLPQPTPKHKERFLILWYENYEIEKLPDTMSQDERILYLFSSYYKLASFNIKSKAKLIYEQRMELLKALTPSIISHEIYHRAVTIGATGNTLLLRNENILNAQTLEEAHKESFKLKESIEDTLIKSAETLKDITGAISKLTKQATSETINLKTVLEETVTLMDTLASRLGVLLELECIDIEVKSDRALFMHLIMNLISNAIEAYENSKSTTKVINIKVDNSNSENIIIYISDNAKEIPNNIKVKLFEEGFSTKSEGNGLGLSICKYITGFLGGEIECNSYKRYYVTTFQVILPRNAFKLTSLEQEVIDV